MKLKPLPGTELSSYVIDVLLAKHGITTVRDFLTAEIAEISKKSNLSTDCVEQLRAKLRDKYNPVRLNLFQQFKNNKVRLKTYKFGIKSLDDLLGCNTLGNTSVFEIFGVGAIGKSRFCHTVVLNIVRSWKVEALYIDTKQDFSASGLFQIMREQNIERIECGQIMQRIKVEVTMSLKGVLEVLMHLEELLKSGDKIVAAIKFIVIDSLPAVWFILNGDEDRSERKYLLSRIANLIHKLAREHYIAVLLVNLAVQDEELFVANTVLTELDFNLAATKIRHPSLDSNTNEVPLKPALGNDWSSVPYVRLCLKMPKDVDEYATERLIEVTRNCYGTSGDSCQIYITNAGVI